jgi:quercetin dioxygenase-like cupin family protein
MAAIEGRCNVRGQAWRAIRSFVLVIAGMAAGAAASHWASARALGPVVDLIAASGTTVAGETIVYPTGVAKVTAAVVSFAPGQETGWHTHAIPGFAYILEGEVTIDYGVKGTRTLKAGEGLLEAVGAPHNGRNTGAGPLRILAVFMGADGLPTSQPAGPP